MSTLSCASALEPAVITDQRIPLDASVADPADVALPCQPIHGQAPSCSQKIALQQALEDFRREAVWGVCNTGRYSCKFSVWGEGPPLVFVPGLCDDPWSYVLPMARLREAFCCIAYQMPAGNGDGARLVHYRHQHL